MANKYFYPYITLTGGADGAVDSLDGSVLSDNDGVFVIEKSSGHMRPYILDEDSAATESSPGVISPDSNAGDKRWIHATFDPAYIPVLQTGTGAVERALSVLGIDIYSVTSWKPATNGTDTAQTAIAAAVLAAYTAGKDLYWPKGTYLTTASIPYLHSVRHWGPGIIKRGANSFYVQPRSSHTNTLYAASDGVATDDGLSATEPITVQGALTALANYGPVLNGKWDVSLAAGTYTETNILFPIGIKSNYAVYIYGPDVSGHPNIPTAIFDGDETSNFAFRLRNGSSSFFQDIKFLDFTGQGGIAATNECLLATKNVHGTNCYDTILSYQGRLYVSGGVFELAVGNYSAIKSMFQNHHNIGYLYNRDTGLHASDGTGLGPSISSVSTRTAMGLHVQENSTGHAAEMVIDNVTKGVEVVASSRVHIAASDFKNCGVAIEVEAGSNVYDAGTNTYNEGTADENDQTLKFLSGSVETSAFSDAFPLYITHRVFTPDTAACTGSTDEITAHTIDDYLAGHEMQRYGTIRVRVAGSISGTNNTKSIRFRIGGHLGPICVFAAATVGDFFAELVMVCSGDDTQNNHGFGVCDNGTAVNTSSTTIDIDDGTAQDLTVSVVLANAADSVTFTYIEVMRGGG